MRNKLIFALAAASVPVFPAYASVIPVPGPEAGVGLAALAALGAGYAWMRRSANRK